MTSYTVVRDAVAKGVSLLDEAMAVLDKPSLGTSSRALGSHPGTAFNRAKRGAPVISLGKSTIV